MKQIIAAMAALAATVAFLYMLTGAITDPNYQGGLTARYQAQQQTRQVQARQQGETARRWAETWETWGMWGFPAVAVIGGAGLASWAIIEWQRNRTRRHEVTEDHTTQRHLISAKKDVALAYLAQCGDPGAYVGQLAGQRGVFLPGTNEFVPERICRAELEQRPGLVPYEPPVIALAAAQPNQSGRVFRVVGEREEWIDGEDW